MTETAIAKRGWHELDMANAGDLASVLVQSGLFKDMKETSAAMVKIVAGRELGIGAFAAMTNIDIVKGQARMRSNLLATMVKQHPRYDYRVREWDETQCRIEFLAIDKVDGEREPLGFGEWTMTEAKKAGIARNGSPWETYPKAMLFARAMSNGVRAHCPDVTAGIPAYTEGDDFGPPVRIHSGPSRTAELDAALEEPPRIGNDEHGTADPCPSPSVDPTVDLDEQDEVPNGLPFD